LLRLLTASELAISGNCELFGPFKILHRDFIMTAVRNMLTGHQLQMWRAGFINR